MKFNQQAKDLNQSQPGEVSPKKQSPMFAFGMGPTHNFKAGPSSSPIIFSNPPSPTPKAILENPRRSEGVWKDSRYGSEGQLGNLLPRQGNSNGGGNNQLDNEGPKGDLGFVWVRASVSMEEYVPSHGFEQEVGLSPTERQSLDAHSKSVVEIPYQLASSASSTFNQPKIISTKIK